MNRTELLFRRRNVRAFIKADPVRVVLVRRVKVDTPGGGWKWGLPQTLAPQEGRLVEAKRRFGDVHVNTEAGSIDKWPYLFLGYHDMDIQEEDTFSIDDEEYVVKSVKADNQERTVSAVDFHGA